MESYLWGTGIYYMCNMTYVIFSRNWILLPVVRRLFQPGTRRDAGHVLEGGNECAVIGRPQLEGAATNVSPDGWAAGADLLAERTQRLGSVNLRSQAQSPERLSGTK